MIIAVTGSSGFVGREIINALKKGNDTVLEIDLLTGIDITRVEDCHSIPRFDIMLHLAAKVFVPDSYKKPEEFYFTNFVGTLNMLELCRKNNARFIYVSSYVYGVPKYVPIDENHPLMAFNPYADTKIMCEELCRSYNKFFNIKTIIVRPTNIYGKGQNENFLLSSILKQAKTGVVNLEDSKPKRDYIYIDDVISAYEKIIYADHLNFEIINIGSGTSYSVKEITDIFNSFFSNKLIINFSELERPNEVQDTRSNIDKAKKILNWKPKFSLIEGIKQMCNA
ncbi:MAG: NAD(P)-dependent oxidoreductase [Bacteroidota bacterium]